MPYQPPSSAQNRLNNSITGFTGVVNTLEVLTEAVKAPFLEPISKTARSVLTLVLTVKQNKSDCSNLIEQTSNLLYAIVSIYAKSATGANLPPSTLNRIGKFMETLHKIHTYVEAQQDKSKIRHFFRQGELNTLLKACGTGLQEALDLENLNIVGNIVDMQKYAEDTHQEVIDFVEALSESTTSDRGSVRMLSTLDNRYN
ncbi:hypothetical protein C8R43DRAFT_965503 [Mycena crocata]|nr:hypothetical protein C8R43DRAFT_965503 [Mycena crocata]